MKIDLVYLWVDGSDEKWLAKKNFWLEKAGELPNDVAGGVRSFDNDELMFSLRSVEKFAPWVNRIFIVTDNQTPKWLDTRHPKITVVDLTEIMPKEFLPSFNSAAIEFFIPNIPNLAEHFLYANDDMMFMAKTEPDFFFTKEGVPIIRANKSIFGKRKLFPIGEKTRALLKKSDHYHCQLLNSKKLIYDIAGDYNYHWEPHHNIDPYRKSDMLEVMDIPLVKNEVEKTAACRFRDNDNVQRQLFHLYGFVKCGYKLIMQTSALRRLAEFATLRFGEKSAYMENVKKQLPPHFIRRKLACIADSGDPKIRKTNRECLRKLYPDKSGFEINSEK